MKFTAFGTGGLISRGKKERKSFCLCISYLGFPRPKGRAYIEVGSQREQDHGGGFPSGQTRMREGPLVYIKRNMLGTFLQQRLRSQNRFPPLESYIEVHTLRRSIRRNTSADGTRPSQGFPSVPSLRELYSNPRRSCPSLPGGRICSWPLPGLREDDLAADPTNEAIPQPAASTGDRTPNEGAAPVVARGLFPSSTQSEHGDRSSSSSSSWLSLPPSTILAARSINCQGAVVLGPAVCRNSCVVVMCLPRNHVNVVDRAAVVALKFYNLPVFWRSAVAGQGERISRWMRTQKLQAGSPYALQRCGTGGIKARGHQVFPVIRLQR